MRTGTILSSSLSLVNTMFGVSILAIPYAYAKCGNVIALSVLFGTALLCGFSRNSEKAIKILTHSC